MQSGYSYIIVPDRLFIHLFAKVVRIGGRLMVAGLSPNIMLYCPKKASTFHWYNRTNEESP